MTLDNCKKLAMRQIRILQSLFCNVWKRYGHPDNNNYTHIHIGYTEGQKRIHRKLRQAIECQLQ